MNYLAIAFPETEVEPPAHLDHGLTLATVLPFVPRTDPPKGPCRTCGGSDFWRPLRTCRRCHPPAPGCEVTS